MISFNLKTKEWERRGEIEEEGIDNIDDGFDFGLDLRRKERKEGVGELDEEEWAKLGEGWGEGEGELQMEDEGERFFFFDPFFLFSHSLIYLSPSLTTFFFFFFFFFNLKCV